MARGASHRVPNRRRRSGRTDYRRRLRLLRGGRPRAVVRKSQRGLTVQFTEFHATGDRVRASAVSRELRKFGWTVSTGSLPAAYLTGYLAGKRATGAGIQAAVLDLGRAAPAKGARVFAAMQGIIDAGVEIPHAEDVRPDPERLGGSHLSEEARKQFTRVKAQLEADA